MLKVLVTGFPDCGTSFLAHLVSEMGFYPGDPSELKKGDDHNRWGYWEHVLMWKAIRWWNGSAIRYIPMPSCGPLPRIDRLAVAVESVIDQTGIEMYKDAAIPFLYRSFPPAMVLWIEREVDALWRSSGLEHLGYKGFTRQDLKEAYCEYRRICFLMGEERDVFVFHYEDFKQDPGTTVARVAHSLNVKEYDLERLKALFRPR